MAFASKSAEKQPLPKAKKALKHHRHDSVAAGAGRGVPWFLKPAGSTSVAPDPEQAERDIAGDVSRPLDAGVQQRFEQAFSHPFGHVRIHDSERAATAATTLHSRAFTRGPDIYFGKGAYAPNTPDGHRLLAHELTHVKQHDLGQLPVSGPSRASSLSDRAEQEASHSERAVATAPDVPVASAPDSGFSASMNPAPVHAGVIHRQAVATPPPVQAPPVPQRGEDEEPPTERVILPLLRGT